MLSIKMAASLASLALLGHSVVADWGLTSKPLVVERIDPIMQPGQISNHSHIIYGANMLSHTYSSASQAKSSCTTVESTADLSSYWHPTLHYQHPNGSYALVPIDAAEFTYMYRAAEGEKIIPYPKGIFMIAGYPFRREYNPANMMDRAVSYSCHGIANQATIPEVPCTTGLYMKITFQSCWDGKSLMHPTMSHISYPTGDPEYTKCPASHPHRFLTLQFRLRFRTELFPFRKNALVFSYGDDLGLGMHADFISHWDVPTLQKIINQCGTSNGAEHCAPLVATFNRQLAESCRPGVNIIDEDYGRLAPVPKLLGDNPRWEGTGPKPSCGCTIPTPKWISPNSTLACGYKRIGCVADSNDRLLKAAMLDDPTGMTGARCSRFCASKGFAYAGTQYERECYCDNKLARGTTPVLINPALCMMQCPGNPNENCGGRSTLTLYHSTRTSKRHGRLVDRSVHDWTV